jgi:hypothetical protein
MDWLINAFLKVCASFCLSVITWAIADGMYDAGWPFWVILIFWTLVVFLGFEAVPDTDADWDIF